MSSSPLSRFDAITEREKGLKRGLSSGQLSMIAIGGAIGTGLFLGSKFAIGFAGPAVLVSYFIGAFIALLLMGCLAEMTVAHPTSGSFGAWAEFYLSPLWGVLVRCAYWAGNALALGTEITAVAAYMQYWFPSVPGWYWILGFSIMMILVNAMHVKFFGMVEYAFSAIKIGAIVAFLILAAWVLFAASHGSSVAGDPPMGFANYSAVGGFFPKGAGGMWTGVLVALFSYFSIEMTAVAAGEAADPTAAITRAFRATLLRLVLFYLLTLALILAIVPWNVMANGATRSPFVTVMLRTHIAGAAGVVNFVILIAALSAMNSQLYITTRMMFSLARAGFAPRSLGVLTRRGVPLGALIFSTVGIAIAAALSVLYHDRAFLLMLAISMFGPMFTWLMIFLTHIRFRQRHKQSQLAFRMWGYPYTTLLGAGLMLSALVTTIFKPDFRPTLVYGVPFLLVMTIVYLVQRSRGGTTALSALEETSLP